MILVIAFISCMINVGNVIASEFDVIPNELICCPRYDSLTCGIYKNKCRWQRSTETCEYKAAVSDEEIILCFTETNTGSCSNELDDDLSSIPVINVRDEIIEHSLSEFALPSEPTIITVTDGVYVAISYDLANAILIETKTGLIVIDTLSESGAARKVFNDYKSLRLKSNSRRDDQMIIEAIILTHYHTDHSMGIGFWFGINEEKGYDISPKVYVNEALLEGFERFFVHSLFPIATRAKRQFGNLMYHELDRDLVNDKNLFINSGIGSHLNKESNGTFINYKDENVIMFTENEYEISVSDISLTLMLTPGETTDQISIWYADKRVLFVGDNLYYAFPNLYSIRGTPPRDPKKWISSLDKFMQFPAEYVVGSHTLPIFGYDNIFTAIQLYRDLIAFVHDQTLRFMAKQWRLNLIIDEIEKTVPTKLRQGRGQEFYGTIEWSVRAIYDMYLGWFEGDSAELYPSNIYDRGEGLFKVFTQLYNQNGNYDDNMINVLVSYLQEILDDAEENKDDSKYVQVALSDERWILEMVSWLSTFYSEYKECDEWRKLMELRWQIMQKMAGRSMSMNGRNYLISQYLEERFNLAHLADEAAANDEILANLPIEFVVELLKYRVRSELILIEDRSWRTNIKFKDSGLMFSLELRNGGVLSVNEYSRLSVAVQDAYDEDAQLIYEMNEIDFKNGEFLTVEYVTKGSLLHIIDFWAKFEQSPEINPKSDEPTSNIDNEKEEDDILAFDTLTSMNMNMFDIANGVDYILESILFDKRDFMWIVFLTGIFTTIASFLLYQYTEKANKVQKGGEYNQICV